jgi:hypothetical protein
MRSILLIVSGAILTAASYGKPLDNYRLLDAEHISADAYNTEPGKRDPYMPDHNGAWKRGANFNLNMRLLEFFKWENRLHMEGGDSRLYSAGWEYRVSMDQWRVQPFYYHHSRHALDDSPNGHLFPVENNVGLRFIFLDKEKK